MKITPERRVKVPDFGLARGDAASTSESGPDLSQSPTISRDAWRAATPRDGERIRL